MINVWQSQLFAHLALPRRGAVWCCAIRCHYGPQKKDQRINEHLPICKQYPQFQNRYASSKSAPYHVPSPMCTPWPPSPHPSAVAVLTQQHTVERSGTLQQKPAPVLLSCHEGTISRVHSTMKNTAVGCLLEGQKAMLRMVSEFRANKPPNEMYGGFDLKPTD